MQIKNKKLAALINKRAPLIEEGREMSKQIDELTEKRNKVALQAQKIQDKITPIIEKEVYPHLTEGEFIESVSLKGDVIEVKTYNHIEAVAEEIKKRWKSEIQDKAK